MKTQMSARWQRWAVAALAGLVISTPAAMARNKKPAPKPPTDSIDVVGHVSTTQPVTRFISTQHYSSYYLYAEHQGGSDITLIDVTKASSPTVLADVPSAGSGSLVSVAGTAALVGAGQNTTAVPAPSQNLKIMDLSDPQHPRVSREFSGVTAIGRDDSRGLVFVANSEGIWILHQNFALDPEVEEEYTREVLYNR
jgi:hypothetical protein